MVIGANADLLQVRDFYGADPGQSASINRIEQKIHLLNSLGHLAGANMMQGLLTIGPEGVADRYGDEASRVVLAAEQKRVNHIERAKWEFAWATGRFVLEESGIMTGVEAKALTRSMFSDFLKKYHLPEDRKIQWDYRRQLEMEVRELQSDRTLFNREQGLRPYQPATKTSEGSPSAHEIKELAFLDTKQRLEAIAEDPRASFLPATHREKNLVMTFLDYLDNPEYPLGINNQFFEVVAHAQKVKRAGVKAGVRAVESIVWEVGDYLANASESVQVLLELRAALRGCSPRVTLTETVGDEHAGLAPLIRYMNIREYLKTGTVAGLKRDSLRTAEERRTAEGPGQHKRVHDQYSRPDRTQAFDKYLRKRPSSLTVGEAWPWLDEAISNETMRANFMAQRLGDVAVLGQYLTMQPVTEAAKTSLSVLQEVA